MAALLDVSALIALVDSEHVGHQAVQRWFLEHHRSGWATCPLTENGMIRILSQPTYPSGRRTPAVVIRILVALKAAFKDSFEFWGDNISICDDVIFDSAVIAGTRQVTDVYLLGLASAHSGTLVSLDRSLAWQAIRGGTPHLIQSPA